MQALNQKTQAAIEQGQKWLREAEQGQREALDQLRSFQLETRSAQATIPANIGTLNPTQMLEQSKNTARRASSRLDQEVQNLIKWRKKRKFRRNLIFAVSGVAILVLVIAIIAFYDNHTKAQLYNSAKVLLESKQPDAAQIQLQKLLKKDPNYRDATALLRKTYYRLEDHFIDNKNKWDEYDTDKVTKKIQNGKYTFQNKMTSSDSLEWISVDMSQNEDFQIESSIAKGDGTDNYGYGLVWGLTDVNNHYYFRISGNGYYLYGKQADGKLTAIIGWTKSNHINQHNSTNKLTIKKSGHQIMFSINDNFVGQAYFERSFGNKIGFRVDPEIKVEIDNVSVYVE
jgi:hypothetical protein